MIKDIEKTSLIECLSWCALRELPQEYDGKNIYIYAVAKVSKTDGSTSYCAITKGNDGNDKVLKDFGTIARISKIEKVYPYVYLDSFYVPNCKNKEEKIKFLASYDNTVDFSKYTAKQLDKEIIVKAIQLQKKSI